MFGEVILTKNKLASSRVVVITTHKPTKIRIRISLLLENRNRLGNWQLQLIQSTNHCTYIHVYSYLTYIIFYSIHYLRPVSRYRRKHLTLALHSGSGHWVGRQIIRYIIQWRMPHLKFEYFIWNRWSDFELTYNNLFSKNVR